MCTAKTAIVLGETPGSCQALGEIRSNFLQHLPRNRGERGVGLRIGWHAVQHVGRGENALGPAVLIDAEKPVGLGVSPGRRAGNGNGPRIQASKKRGDKVQSRRKRQQHRLARQVPRLQPTADPPGFGIQIGIRPFKPGRGAFVGIGAKNPLGMSEALAASTVPQSKNCRRYHRTGFGFINVNFITTRPYPRQTLAHGVIAFSAEISSARTNSLQVIRDLSRGEWANMVGIMEVT